LIPQATQPLVPAGGPGVFTCLEPTVSAGKPCGA
jgi:hypothetical protein